MPLPEQVAEITIVCLFIFKLYIIKKYSQKSRGNSTMDIYSIVYIRAVEQTPLCLQPIFNYCLRYDIFASSRSYF